jgi:hypothetical protein
MKTDDLIAALAAGAAPVRPRGLERALVLWALPAALAAFIGVWFYLLPRADLTQAMGGAAFWMKAGYTAALAVGGGWLFSRLGRPGADVRAPGLAVLAVIGAAVALGAAELIFTPAEQRMALILGSSWKTCPPNIAFLSALAAPFLFWTARRFAPTSPTRAGAAAGLMTGALAATLYGLHCPESAAAFVAVWYTLGIAAATAAGAAIGKFWLRW